MPNEPSQISLNYEIAKRAMKLLADQGSLGYLDIIGLSLDDFRRVTSNVPWSGVDRNRNTASLNTLISGAQRAAGLPPFEIPAEWAAACILNFVAPINISLACSYVERPGSASDLSRGVDEGTMDRCTARQLFALCVSLYDCNEHNEARRLFESKTKLKLESLVENAEGSIQNAKKK